MLLNGLFPAARVSIALLLPLLGLPDWVSGSIRMLSIIGMGGSCGLPPSPGRTVSGIGIRGDVSLPRLLDLGRPYWPISNSSSSSYGRLVVTPKLCSKDGRGREGLRSLMLLIPLR